MAKKPITKARPKPPPAPIVCYWDTELTPEEIEQFRAGKDPATIRPDHYKRLPGKTLVTVVYESDYLLQTAEFDRALRLLSAARHLIAIGTTLRQEIDDFVKEHEGAPE